jgi:hypothetical protein
VLVERSRQGAPDDPEAQAEVLKELLGQLSVDDVVKFDECFTDANLALYTWNMWGAATLMLGWSSDDVFADFRSWVISLGRETYDRVAADPDALAEVDMEDPEEPAVGELFGSVASEVYEAATGRYLGDVDPDRQAPTAPDGDPAGERFERTDEELCRRYPRLASRWMAPEGGALPGQLPRSL